MENKGRIFVMGDIHGAHRALVQCLERAGFDKENDTLIQLGDVSDGWPETPQCVEELLSIKNLIAIRGNHDKWTLDWMETTEAPYIWVNQGGKATKEAYENMRMYDDFDWDGHVKFFKYQHNYYKDDDNRVFVHGGYKSDKGIGHESVQYNYYWDRSLWFDQAKAGRNSQTLPKKLAKHKEIYIGHTSTVHYKQDDPAPQNHCNVWNLDTGGGWGGFLTIMDIDTKEYWQSDRVKDLYVGVQGR